MSSSNCKVLTFSTAFPNPSEPGLGIFVRARAAEVSRETPVIVAAPVALFKGASVSKAWKSVPRERMDESLLVYHPRWLNVPGGSPINALFLAISVLWLILRKGLNIDVIDAHFGYLDGVAAALVSAILRKPLILTLRGSEVVHAKYRMRRMAMRWCLRRSSRVIALSSELRELAIALGVNESAVTVITNGVDSTLFSARFREPFERRERCGVHRILAAGSLIRLKGHDRIIRAVAALVARGFDIVLVIAGSESPSEPACAMELRELVEALSLTDRVLFAGRLSQPELAAMMSASSVLCLASEREGCPNVVREALACGTPVVATRVGAVPDLLPDERYGLTVPAGDDAALEAALATALLRNWDHAEIARWGASRDWSAVATDVMHEIQLAFGG